MAPRVDSVAFFERVTHWRWSRGVWAGIGLLAVLTVLYLASHAARGTLALIAAESGPLRLSPLVRGDLVLVLVSAYTFGAMLTGLGAAARDLGALQPVLTAGDAVREQLSRRLVPGQGELLLAALVGGASGVTIALLPSDSPGSASTSTALMFFLFALLGIHALITLRQSSVFSDVGAHHVRVNLLDLTPLATFARNGARNAGYWLLGSTMASLLFASVATPWIVALVLFATVGIGVLGMLLLSRGLHLRIRACKRRELSRVRAEAEREVAGLFSTETSSANGGRLPSLLAYEARIHAVHEWPFDTATLGRFLLFLVIPLASWIGGALVERVVNAALE